MENSNSSVGKPKKIKLDFRESKYATGRRKKSIANKLDHKITNRIWKNMIWSYIDYERRNFKKK